MKKIGEFNYDNLLGGDFPRSCAEVTLLQGRVYPTGAVLGVRTSSGVATLVDSAADDGTEKIHGILVEKVDATEANTVGVVYLTGEFNQHALTFGGSDTYETHRVDARALCIFFKDAARQPHQ